MLCDEMAAAAFRAVAVVLDRRCDSLDEARKLLSNCERVVVVATCLLIAEMPKPDGAADGEWRVVAGVWDVSVVVVGDG